MSGTCYKYTWHVLKQSYHAMIRMFLLDVNHNCVQRIVRISKYRQGLHERQWYVQFHGKS